jgi:hypothetical protein
MPLPLGFVPPYLPTQGTEAASQRAIAAREHDFFDRAQGLAG